MGIRIFVHLFKFLWDEIIHTYPKFNSDWPHRHWSDATRV